MSERISKCVPVRCCSDGLMFRLYSPFLAPVFLPKWVEDKIGGAFACYAFTAWVEGALRRSKRRRTERRGRMHGRVSAVAVWTELYCPGNLSVASPRSLFLPFPPPNTVFLPQTQKHVNTHTLSTSQHFTQSFQSPSHSLWCLSWYPPFPLLSSLLSQADMARPSSSSPPVAHYFTSFIWLSCQTDSKTRWKQMQSSPSHPVFSTEFLKCLCRLINPRRSFAPNQTLLTVFSVLCGSTSWCNFTLCLFLLAQGCRGLQGVASWENRTRWGLGWWELISVSLFCLGQLEWHDL